MRSRGVGGALQIQHHARDSVLRFRHTDLPDQSIRHRDHGSAFSSQHRLGAGEVEKEPIRILQTIRANCEVPVRFDGDACDIAERPESHSGDMVCLYAIARPKPGG